MKRGNKKVLFQNVVVNPGRSGAQVWSCEQGMSMGAWYHLLCDKGIDVLHLKPFGSK